MVFLWLINAGYEPLNWDDPPSFPRFVPFKKSHIFLKKILPYKPSWRCLLGEILVILSVYPKVPKFAAKGYVGSLFLQ